MIYAECGNVVSAAVPTAMALAEARGSLRRGQRVATWVASAGMSFTTSYSSFDLGTLILVNASSPDVRFAGDRTSKSYAEPS
jgi:hypothetical protein